GLILLPAQREAQCSRDQQVALDLGTVVDRARSGAVRPVEPQVCTRPVTADQRREREVEHAEALAGNRGVGKLAQTLLELRAGGREPPTETMLREQIERPSRVSRGDVVADRTREIAETLVRLGGSAVECQRPRAVASLELGAQEVAKQVVVAKARAIGI